MHIRKIKLYCIVLSCMQSLYRNKIEKCGIYAAFLMIILIKPRAMYHYAYGFKVSPAKPKKTIE